LKEKPIRSVVKALSWRITATLLIFLGSYLITGKLEQALTIGAFDFIVKLCIYYIHERIWNKIKFGRVKEYPPDYSI
jgi:uncharacterized membrane protein